MAKLTITSEDHGETNEVELGLAPLTLGRDEHNALVIKDDLASRRHAVIERTQEGYLFKDVGSSNGTWIKDERISERLLQDGDELRIGRQEPDGQRVVRHERLHRPGHHRRDRRQQQRHGQPAPTDKDVDHGRRSSM